MANELQTLSQLFQNRLFRIPDYQRGYAWKQHQLIDFWDDLINLQDNKYHYTGLLSLKNLSKKELKQWGDDIWIMDKGFKACHVVDGQQRLTTFVILLNEIILFARTIDGNKGKIDDEIVLGYDTLKEIIAKYICQSRPPHNQITTHLFGYESDNPSADYLKYKILGAKYAGTVNETYYTQNLKFAKTFFWENLVDYYKSGGIEIINELYLKLTQKLMFNIHEIDDDYDVFVAFETMNNRGKKLTNLELLKNRLIYLTTLYDESQFDEMDKQHLRKQINDAWKEVYYQLGRNENTPLSDDDFLRAHWTIYFSYSRKKGDDYIHFLLNKFSAKNIFSKKPIILNENHGEVEDTDDFEEDISFETETIEVSKLEPKEIADYVNSLKSVAKFWYDTFFPMKSENLTKEEQIWIDKLNRIGIGHFRPLIAVIISRRDYTAEERILSFKAIERFIFICFRLGNYNTSYRSSEYYRATRSLYLNEILLADLVKDIVENTDSNIEYALPNFVAKIEKHFSDKGGFYYWKPIRYFLYEYETSLAIKNNIDRIGNWDMFTKTEKDKFSIEHILPQTPVKHYWRNEYRQFTGEEKEMLSGALGNLLPLSLSVNSSLQNVSFYDKRKSTEHGRRGYENGCHAEIEVAQYNEWTAKHIYNRSKKLLEFMEKRWEFSLSTEQLYSLIHVNFVTDGREIPEPIPEEIDTKIDSKTHEALENGTELENQRYNFWSNFVLYCEKEGYKSTIGNRKPTTDAWYAISVGTADYHIEYTITRSRYLTILIYAENTDVFHRLEDKKSEIEESFGYKLDWYSSKAGSNAKRILYKKECEIFNPTKQEELFEWMITLFESLCNALMEVGELNISQLPMAGKFDEITKYLQSCEANKLTLSFAEIEKIIGTELCKSAYTYSVYWKPSETHTMANAIVAAGYDVVGVDLVAKNISFGKKTWCFDEKN